MAELTPSERLQPCLLDRLTDDEPDKSVESRDRRVLSLRQVRNAVLRDLAWLMNTPQRLDDEIAEEFPNAASSVVNFGVPDLCGLTPSGLDLVTLERIVRDSVKQFEPRIIGSTLQVRAVIDEGAMNRGALSFEIGGDLWAKPAPDPLYVQTAVDLETGQFDVTEGEPG
ncbi:MAG: type VI secretion system baseplate subunit TssE [Phycisphaerae bacterium]|nr:type VI secretion system baseplate subunit TssE [Phycisphaerae bacterium]